VALQVVCLLACRQARQGLVAVPVTASRNIEKIAARYGMNVVRSRTLPRSLMETAARDGMAFAGDGAGGYVFPRFQPAFDGMFSIIKILELLGSEGRGIHDILREIPPTTLIHRNVPCAWEHKGALMRMLALHAKGKQSQFIDGVKVFEGEDWALAYPSQDSAYFHLVVEAGDRDVATKMADHYADLFQTWSRQL
jgi:mannose-1-phosphate guanylyltransferase / phosphomannomutase